MFGVAAEIFGEALVPYVPKILQALTKLIKEEATTRLHVAIAETVGNLVLQTVDKLITTAEQQDLFENQYLRFVFNLIEKSNNKIAQSCAISCLSKVVVCCPDAILVGSLEETTDKIVILLKMKTFQNK